VKFENKKFKTIVTVPGQIEVLVITIIGQGNQAICNALKSTGIKAKID